jgi:hypothetical protein
MDGLAGRQRWSVAGFDLLPSQQKNTTLKSLKTRPCFKNGM